MIRHKFARQAVSFALAALAPASAALALDHDADHKVSLTGVYNTGQTDLDNPSPTTLNVAFDACEDEDGEPRICGTIVSIVNPQPDQPQALPDGSPLIGFKMITGLKDRGNGSYRRGRINAVDESLDSGEMKWYGLRINKLADGNLEVSGCVGFVCPRSFTWTKVEDGLETDAQEAEDLTTDAPAETDGASEDAIQ